MKKFDDMPADKEGGEFVIPSLQCLDNLGKIYREILYIYREISYMEILYGEILNLRDLDSALTTCEGETEEMRRETNQLKLEYQEMCCN